jgi:hypothetical protein
VREPQLPNIAMACSTAISAVSSKQRLQRSLCFVLMLDFFDSLAVLAVLHFTRSWVMLYFNIGGQMYSKKVRLKSYWESFLKWERSLAMYSAKRAGGADIYLV